MSPASVFPGGWIRPSVGNAQAAAELKVALRLRNAVEFAGMQGDQSVIRRQRGIVSVDRIERKIRGRREMNHLRGGGFELEAKCIMLGLRGGEIRRVQKSQLLPAFCDGRLVPSRCPRRAHQYSLQASHHGMTVERPAVDRDTLQFARWVQMSATTFPIAI